MTERPLERVLIWDRMDANRRASLIFTFVFAIVMLPAVVYLGQYLMVWVAITVGSADDFLWETDFALALALTAAVSFVILAALAYAQYVFAAGLVLRLSGARPVARDGEPQFVRTVENLCIGAGLPQPRLYVSEEPAANAFSTGLNPESSSLVVTRGLLDRLDRRELEGVLAHELAQIANGDTRLGTVLAAGVALLRLPLAIVVGVIRLLFRIHPVVGVVAMLYLGLPLLSALPLSVVLAADLLRDDTLTGVLIIVAMMLPVYAFVPAPLLAELFRALALRGREHLADADALLLTRHPEGLARALAKIGDPEASALPVAAAVAHLYVVDPLPGALPWQRLFATHPPVGGRIARLAAMAGVSLSAIEASGEPAP